MGGVSALSAEQRGIIKEFESYLDPNAEEFIRDLKYDLRNDWDRIIVITGQRGVGKSTLALLLVKLVDYHFKFNRMAFQPDEIIPIIQGMNAYEGMVMDEGGEIWGRQDWATKVSINITKQFQGDRYRNSIRFVLAPNIFYLNRKAIDMAHYWIKVYSPDNRTRGFAELRLVSEKDYHDKKLPYAPAIMDIEFCDVPKEISTAYRKYKADQGAKRSNIYQTEIEDKMHGKLPNYIDPSQVASEVLEDPRKYMTELKEGDKQFDWRKIWADYNAEGLGQERAKNVAYVLNRKLVETDDF